MDIDIIGAPVFYGCDKRGVDYGATMLMNSGLIEVFKKYHNVEYYGDISIPNINEKDKYAINKKMKYLDGVIQANLNLKEKVYKSLIKNKMPIIIGGDHSVALGSIAGGIKYYGDDYAVVWIDAHADLNTDDTTPSGNIHGMPLATALGLGHESLQSIYSDTLKLKPKNLYILGCRDLDWGEKEIIQKMNINTKSVEQTKDKGIDVVVDQIVLELKMNNIHNVHVSFDIDCMDPSEAPGTGTPVHGGFLMKACEIILIKLIDSSLVKSFDFVEYNPLLDEDYQTRNICMKLMDTISLASTRIFTR